MKKLILITGGSASGKSEFAENLAMKLGANRLYIATMMPYGDDEECKKRINRHQCMRKDKGFDSLECYLDLANALKENAAHYDVVLLECMSNLLANEDYMGDYHRIIDGVKALQDTVDNVVIVSNEVFSDTGIDNYLDETLSYIKKLGDINKEIGKLADIVIEVVFTIPIIHKGESCFEEII